MHAQGRVPAASGAVVSVRGSVVDIRFETRLPPIHSLLRAGEDGRMVIEVLAQRDERHVRGIALTPTQGLARGSAVQDTGGPLKAPVGQAYIFSILAAVYIAVVSSIPLTRSGAVSNRTRTSAENVSLSARWMSARASAGRSNALRTIAGADSNFRPSSVPADDKKNARLIISEIVLDVFKGLRMTVPKPTAKRLRELQVIRKTLVK